jgi:hypothetical protein
MTVFGLDPHVSVSRRSMLQNRPIMFWNELRMCTTPSAAQQICLLTSAFSSRSLSLSAYRARFGQAPRLWSRARHSRSVMVMAYICGNQSSCMLMCGGCSESMTSRLCRSFPSVVLQRVLNGKKNDKCRSPIPCVLGLLHQSLGTNAP